MNEVKTEYRDWQSINWKQIEKIVFKLQKRIYQAKRNGNNQASQITATVVSKQS